MESTDPEHVEDMWLSLIGAVRARDATGAMVEPTLVVNGSQVAAVYPVTPLPPGQPAGRTASRGRATARGAGGDRVDLAAHGRADRRGSAGDTAAALSVR